MKLLKSALLGMVAMVLTLQATFASSVVKDNDVKPEKVFVIFRGSHKATPYFDNFRETFSEQFAEEGIKAAFHLADSPNVGNQIFKLALDAGADYIILVDQTKQHSIDSNTNVGGNFSVKYFSLTKDYTWKDVEDNLKMNVQVKQSVLNANKQLLASFLTKVEYDNSQLAKN